MDTATAGRNLKSAARLFGEIASNRRQNFLPSPLVMVKRGMVEK